MCRVNDIDIEPKTVEQVWREGRARKTNDSGTHKFNYSSAQNLYSCALFIINQRGTYYARNTYKQTYMYV